MWIKLLVLGGDVSCGALHVHKSDSLVDSLQENFFIASYMVWMTFVYMFHVERRRFGEINMCITFRVLFCRGFLSLVFV